MALKITRYTTDCDENTADEVFWEDDEGEWVKYEDHEDMMFLAERRREPVESEEAPDWLVQVRAEAADREAQALREGLEQWKAAWHEGDAIRAKLQARIDELTGQRREANARATKAETELQEARHKLSTAGWVHEEMQKALPGWKWAFAAHVGERWDKGETTAPEQLAFVFKRLRDEIAGLRIATGIAGGGLGA